MIVWFPDEKVIRLIGADRKMNGHAAAMDRYESERERWTITRLFQSVRVV
jgi:hypothetical protein